MPGYFVHESAFVDEGASVGAGTRIWHFSHVQSGASIGRDCSLGQNVNVAANARIGDGCRIQNNVAVYEGVELEDYVFCGPSCVFTNDLTPRAKYPKGPAAFKRTVVREGASIGANATIVCGNEIGARAPWSRQTSGRMRSCWECRRGSMDGHANAEPSFPKIWHARFAGGRTCKAMRD